MVSEWWRDVPGYDGYYLVSNYGRVRSVTRVVPKGKWGRYRVVGRMLKQAFRGKHKFVILCGPEGKRSHSVHRLVLEAFVGPCPEGMQGCHNNGVASDNKLDNLRWDTQLANAKDSIRHGVQMMGESHWKAKLTEDQVAEIKRLSREGWRNYELAKKFKVK